MIVASGVGRPLPSGYRGDVVVAAAVLASTAAAAWAQWTPSGISWHYAVEGAADLFGADGLHLYARAPQLQIGPLTFVVVAPLRLLGPTAARVVAQCLLALAGPGALFLLRPLVAGSAGRRAARLLLAGTVLAWPWTVLAVRWAHPDDVLAILFGVVAVRCVAARRSGWAGVALAVAVAAKPWAVGFLAVLWPLGPDAGAGLATFAAGVLVGWGPFLVVPGTLNAAHPPVGIADASALRLFGVGGDVVPGWTRTAQLLAAGLAGLAAALRHRWPAALLLALAVRLALDPQVIAYYAGSAVLAALVVDLLLTRSLIPWTAVATAVVMWQPFVPDYARRFALAHGPALWWFRHQTVVGVVHLLWSVAVVVAVLIHPPHAPDDQRA